MSKKRRKKRKYVCEGSVKGKLSSENTRMTTSNRTDLPTMRDETRAHDDTRHRTRRKTDLMTRDGDRLTHGRTRHRSRPKTDLPPTRNDTQTYETTRVTKRQNIDLQLIVSEFHALIGQHVCNPDRVPER